MFSDPLALPNRDNTADDGSYLGTTSDWRLIKTTDSYREYYSEDTSPTGYTLSTVLRLGHYQLKDGRTRHTITVISTREYDDTTVDDVVSATSFSVTISDEGVAGVWADSVNPLAHVLHFLRGAPTDWSNAERFLTGEM